MVQQRGQLKPVGMGRHSAVPGDTGRSSVRPGIAWFAGPGRAGLRRMDADHRDECRAAVVWSAAEGIDTQIAADTARRPSAAKTLIPG